MSDEGPVDDRQGGKVGVLHRITSFFALHEDDEEEQYEEEAQPRRNVVSFAGREGRRLSAAGSEVSVFMPRSFGDVTEIADALRGNRVVIVNLQGIERPLLQRIVDFTSGVAYTLDGKIQKLAEAMYLVVPSGVTVNSQGLRDSLLGRDGSLDFMDRG